MWDSVSSSCEDGDKPSGYLTGEEFFDQLGTQQTVKQTLLHAVHSVFLLTDAMEQFILTVRVHTGHYTVRLMA